MAAIIELILVVGIGVHSVCLASAETASHATGASSPGAASTRAATALSRASSTITGHSLNRRQGGGRRGTSCNTYTIGYIALNVELND